jgi:hypothetical protein
MPLFSEPLLRISGFLTQILHQMHHSLQVFLHLNLRNIELTIVWTTHFAIRLANCWPPVAYQTADRLVADCPVTALWHSNC